MRKILSTLVVIILTAFTARAQFTDGATGLMQMPTAEMQRDGTFMITDNFLNVHSLPTMWHYHTFQYGFFVSFWQRMEIGYICTLFIGAWDKRENLSYRDQIIRNQDRHFSARICLLHEGEFGWNWVPALVVGAIDPMSGGLTDYLKLEKVKGDGNGFFNRYYAVMSKHFQTPWGELGAHAGYQINWRTDYPINGPCAGINWHPVWLQQQGILDDVNVMLEYDSRTVNMGLLASIWDNHIEGMFELQNFRWINFGLRYKVRLKK